MSDCSITFLPQNKTVVVKSGTSLLEAASRAEIIINNLCGGNGLCKRCKMVIVSGDTPQKGSDEIRHDMERAEILSCMTHVKNDLTVEISEETMAKEKDELDEHTRRFIEKELLFQEDDYRASPLVKKIFLELKTPTLTDNTADHQRVCDVLKKKLNAKSLDVELKILQVLPRILRKNNYRLTATVGFTGDGYKILRIEGGDTTGKNHMVVVDVGTTTIVAHLINSFSFGLVDAKAIFNSQGIYGREVTGRMITAEKKGGKELQKFLIKDINDLIAGLVKDNPLNRKDITAVVCSGNTIMSHFLLGLETKNIRRSPYIPVTVEPQPICASDVGIKIGPGGLLYPLPCISGWVGSDITAGILATGIHKKEEISLLIDMGTNGEMVVGNKEWMVASSASAGPALEGEGVACGMMAEMGAIEHFFLKEGQITCQTIGNLPAKGICGSGIIDLVNVLLKKQVIDRSGTFMDKEITKFHITDNIYICESDLESIITAKAAIYAALKILLKRLHLSLSDISHLYIAGAFGKYINKENAIAIGLIPNISHEKIEYVGNTSIRGSRVVALHEETFQEITEIAKKATYYDLMGESDYVEEFKKALFLPHTDIEEFKRVIS